jgi:nitrate reductase gamma subunit
MRILYPFLAVLAVSVIAYLGGKVTGLQYLFGVVLPYLAFGVFIVGFIYRVVQWGKSPVPFRIPTTCGQEKSLDWIQQDRLDCPNNKLEVIGRMILEVFLFRSLFRNTQAEVHDGPKLVYGSSKWLWLFAILFHYSFLIVVIRHLRLFTEPVPYFVSLTEFFDGILQIGAPTMYQTDALLLGGVALLFLRRVMLRQVRYISLAADYFPLFLIFGIALSGVLMRFYFRVDVTAIKELTVGIASLSPTLPAGIHPIFFVHTLLVCILLIYFPFSKLMHMGGVFLSPTRNMSNNSRSVRHINPWNDPSIKPHAYADYEDEFRDVMKEAGIPLEKE